MYYVVMSLYKIKASNSEDGTDSLSIIVHHRDNSRWA